jgi:hypothetical protein
MPIEKIEKKIKQIQSTPVNSTNPWLEIWNMDNPVKKKKQNKSWNLRPNNSMLNDENKKNQFLKRT